MRVFLQPPEGLSRAMARVAAALSNHVPKGSGIEIVPRIDDADLVVLHVIGYPETRTATLDCLEVGQKYAMIQYCMRSTQEPNVGPWKAMWEGAQVVWSYYDLPKIARADGYLPEMRFYLAPMGVDDIFRHTEPYQMKTHTMLTSGFVAESESIAEVTQAVRHVGGHQFHLGPRTAAPDADLCGLDIGDPTLAERYARTCWVSGLRRAEGFEMPAAEGLCCGAIPIVFDAPHYRLWYDGLAEFIPEGTFEEVKNALIAIFERGFDPRPDAMRIARERFDWKQIASGFWREVCSA